MFPVNVAVVCQSSADLIDLLAWLNICPHCQAIIADRFAGRLQYCLNTLGICHRMEPPFLHHHGNETASHSPLCKNAATARRVAMCGRGLFHLHLAGFRNPVDREGHRVVQPCDARGERCVRREPGGQGEREVGIGSVAPMQGEIEQRARESLPRLILPAAVGKAPDADPARRVVDIPDDEIGTGIVRGRVVCLEIAVIAQPVHEPGPHIPVAVPRLRTLRRAGSRACRHPHHLPRAADRTPALAVVLPQQ